MENLPALSELETELLNACKIALRQLDYDGDDKTAFHGAAFDALTKAIKAAEGKIMAPDNALRCKS